MCYSLLSPKLTILDSFFEKNRNKFFLIFFGFLLSYTHEKLRIFSKNLAFWSTSPGPAEAPERTLEKPSYNKSGPKCSAELGLFISLALGGPKCPENDKNRKKRAFLGSFLAKKRQNLNFWEPRLWNIDLLQHFTPKKHFIKKSFGKAPKTCFWAPTFGAARKGQNWKYRKIAILTWSDICRRKH